MSKQPTSDLQLIRERADTAHKMGCAGSFCSCGLSEATDADVRFLLAEIERLRTLYRKATAELRKLDGGGGHLFDGDMP